MSRLERLQAHEKFIETKLQKNMNWRLASGGLMVAFFTLFGLKVGDLYLILPGIVALIAFVYGLRQTRRLRRHLTLVRRWILFLNRQQDRSRGHSTGLRPYSPDLSDEEDILANDLNLFGFHSIFDQLDECLSTGGRKQLAEWLVKPNLSTEQILARQNDVKALARRHWQIVKFRLQLENDEALDASVLEEDLKSPVVGPRFYAFFIGHLIAWPLTWFVVIASLNGWLKLTPAIPLIAYLFYSLWSRSQVEFSFSKGQSFALQLGALLPLLKYIEKTFNSEPTEKHFKVILRERPSFQLQNVSRLVGFLSVQAHPLIHLIVAVLLPWEFIWSWRLEHWRRKMSNLLPHYFSELHHFEALMSLYFFYHYQTQTWPEFSTQTHFKAEGLFHPLIERQRVVANDINMPPTTQLFLITGSNMSGKSTFLRTVGVNQCLAMMGAPVLAKSMTTTPMPVKTSLRVTDSISQSYSSFFYEVRRIRSMLECARRGEAFLYLVDEIFRGTNNRERLEGSRAVITELLSYPQIFGLVSTHDLELTAIANTHKTAENWHFGDSMENGHLVFPYKLTPGPCPTTNALKIMQQEGLPVKIPDPS